MFNTKNILATFLLFFSILLKGQEPDFNMNGFASVIYNSDNSTTGGNSGDTVFVHTFSELETYAKSREKNTTPEILIISGYIESNPTTVITFKHGANLTILGANNGAELNGIGIRVWDYNNVIIRNLKIHEIFYPDDALSVEECQHVWIDHNELYSKIGAGIGVDTYDGLLDIKKGSSYVTVSWNYLHHHMKCMLIGHTDNASQGVEDKEMRTTIHHNIFERTNGRNPSLRWGAAHIYNNYYTDIDDYGIALRQGAHALIENNKFNNVQTCISTNKFDGEGFACLSGNTYSGTAFESLNSITQTVCEFWNELPYSYALDSTEHLEEILRNNVGIGKIITASVKTDSTNTNGITNLNKHKLKCFPNPFQDQFNIVFNIDKDEAIVLTLTNTSGQILLIKEIHAKIGNNSIPISTVNLQKGMYLINLNNSGSKTLIVKK